MKNVIFLVSMLFGFVLQSCNDNEMSVDIIDYGRETSYQIGNQTDKVLTIVRVYGYITTGDKTNELSETISIAP